MLLILNQESVQEAMERLCGLQDHLDLMGDKENVSALVEIERLLREGIIDDGVDD